VKNVFLCALSLFCVAPLYGQVTIVKPIPQTATIEVNAAQTGNQQIPRTIFGTFLEPLGNSTYNGLWAELLQNPSFESGLWSPGRVADMLHETPELQQSGRLALPLPWEPLDARQGNRYELNYGDAANNRCVFSASPASLRESSKRSIFPPIVRATMSAASMRGT
jgi:alpha-N-arabinofuranosidase